MLRVEEGNDIFCSVTGTYQPSFFGLPLTLLAALPRYRRRPFSERPRIGRDFPHILVLRWMSMGGDVESPDMGFSKDHPERVHPRMSVLKSCIAEATGNICFCVYDRKEDYTFK